MDKIWFIKSDKKKGGPFTEAQLVKLIKAKVIDDKFLIYNKSLKDWINISETIYDIYLKG